MSFVPAEFSTPIRAYASAPISTMCGIVESVSTLLMSVGPWNRPAFAGNGGFRRGLPRLPSSESSSPVSSPQMYAPAPRETCSDRLNPEPRMSSPR